MLVRMASSCLTLSTLLLLAFAGSASAQSPCLYSSSDLLYFSCMDYLTVASEPSPDTTCCSAVVSVTTDFGSDCLCQVIQYQQANPDPTEPIIPGRMNNLNGDCSANADMTNCSGSSPSPVGGVTAPPASVTAPWGSGTGSTPPGVETPILGGTSPSTKGSKASTGALVGGSVGGLSVFGVIVYVIIKCLQNSNFEIKCDMNAPCCCCQRRSEKTHPCENPSHGGTVHHLAPSPSPYPSPYPPPYRAPYPLHFGARA